MATKKSPVRKLTCEDYEKTSDDERYELMDGVLTMAPAPDRDHQSILVTLTLLIGNFLLRANLGRLYVAPRDVYFTDTDIVQPDLLFISNERLDIDTEGPVRGAPDLAVEIRSHSTANRDWTVKRDLYARHGVREYWIIDPQARTITVMALAEGNLGVTHVHGENDALVSFVLDGFTTSVREIFRNLVQ